MFCAAVSLTCKMTGMYVCGPLRIMLHTLPDLLLRFACFLLVVYCSVLELPCPTAERVHAFQGMLSVLRHNPNLVLGNKTHIYSLLTALAAWQDESPPESLMQGFREILHAVRAHNPTMWNRVAAKFALHYDYHALAAQYQLQT
jgi:hypothetical protein